MVTEEVDIGLRPALIPPTIQAILVYHRGFIGMVKTEVEICIRPDNFIHITLVDTQGFLKKIFQGVCKEKINIKIILINFTHAFHQTLIPA